MGRKRARPGVITPVAILADTDDAEPGTEARELPVVSIGQHDSYNSI